jgi:Dyp-type peroxidase family
MQMRTEPQVDLSQIQGNIVPGFYKDAQNFVFVRFPSADAGRAWLNAIFPAVSWADEVAAVNQQYIDAKRANPGRTVPVDPRLFVNVALSFAGLQKIGARNRGLFPQEFKADPKQRAQRLNDFDFGFADWPVGGPQTEADAVLVVGGNSDADVELVQNDLTGGVEILKGGICRGRSLGNGREHFGFKDGLSQPDPPEPKDLAAWTVNAGADVIAPGEFIVGLPDQTGARSNGGPPWASNGSYMVFRRFQQDVDGFNAETKRIADHLAGQGVGLSDDQVAALLLGRTRDGRLLALRNFSDDELGTKCPWFAHIRKANPRDRPEENPDTHRIIRRGIVYGSPGETDKGMLFVCYQASIARQFEQIYTQWLGASTFPSPPGEFIAKYHLSPTETPGPDPLIGWAGQDQPRRVILHTGGLPTNLVPLDIAAFTTVTASGYFFAPSRDGLGRLAGGTEIAGAVPA